MALPTTGESAGPEAIGRVAELCQGVGIARVWSVDRLLKPLGKDAYIAEHYSVTYDPLESLVWAAAHAPRIGLGTSVIVLPFQNPVALARRIATLDRFASGRLLVGLGAGHIPEEFACVGVARPERGRRLEEGISVLRRVWGPDPVEFHGAFTDVAPSNIGPKPLQEGGPRMILATMSKAAVERAGRFGLGINPLVGDGSGLASTVAEWSRVLKGHGFDPCGLDVVVRTNRRVFGVGAAGPDGFASWPRDRVIEDLHSLEQAGATEVLYELHDPIRGLEEAIAEVAGIDRDLTGVGANGR